MTPDCCRNCDFLDLLVEARDLSGEIVDLLDRLNHRLVETLLNFAEITTRLIEGVRKVLAGRDYRLPVRSAGGIRRQRLKTVIKFVR